MALIVCLFNSSILSQSGSKIGGRLSCEAHLPTVGVYFSTVVCVCISAVHVFECKTSVEGDRGNKVQGGQTSMWIWPKSNLNDS